MTPVMGQLLSSDDWPGKYCGVKVFIFKILLIRKFILTKSGRDHLFPFQCMVYLDKGKKYLFSRRCRPEYLFELFLKAKKLPVPHSETNGLIQEKETQLKIQ